MDTLLPSQLATPNTLPYIVEISDFIRRRVIDCLLKSGLSMVKCYDILHQIHFLNEEKALDFGNDEYHRNHDTCLSVREHDSMSLLPAFYLHEVYRSVFECLDQTVIDGDFFDYLTIFGMLLTLCHVPHDGAGRTNEDFLVLFCRKNKLDLTFSRNGYRENGDRSGLVHKRLLDFKMFLAEITNLDTSAIELSPERDLLISKVSKPYTKDRSDIAMRKANDVDFIKYQLQKYQAAKMFLAALKGQIPLNQIKTAFPESFKASRETIISGTKREYEYLS